MNLEQNDYFTILKFVDDDKESNFLESENPEQMLGMGFVKKIISPGGRDNFKEKGFIYQVLRIEFPVVLGKCVAIGSGFEHQLYRGEVKTFDMREIEVMVLSESFVSQLNYEYDAYLRKMNDLSRQYSSSNLSCVGGVDRANSLLSLLNDDFKNDNKDDSKNDNKDDSKNNNKSDKKNKNEDKGEDK